MKSRKEGISYNSVGMVAGLILAAGESSRMGRPKAFLRHEGTGTTFLAHLAREAATAGLRPVLVVGRPGDTALELATLQAGARYVSNPTAERGQLTSIIAGLDSLDEAVSAAVIMPVDVPLIRASTIAQLLGAVEADDVEIVRVAHGGRHGHPVLFTRHVFDELRHADPNVGARAIVRAYPARVKTVEVDDPGVTMDIDTPEDYFRVFGSRL